MSAKTLQKQKSRLKYFKVGDSDANVLDSRNWNFVYVGASSECLQQLTSVSGKGYQVADLSELRLFLSDRNNTAKSVRIVYIDLPFQEEKMKAFSGWLKKHSALSSTMVFLNSRQMSVAERRLVARHRLADELLDFRTEFELIPGKIQVLGSLHQALRQPESKFRSERHLADLGVNTYGIKRILDIVVAAILLVILAPVFLIIALAVQIESGGPVFYNSYRAGRGYKIFRFYKFRTMRVGADRMVHSLFHLNKYNTCLGPVFFKIHNDPRITRVGGFLRNTGLDELPQLINVLKGDMSLVGNRPLPLFEAATLTTDDWAERFIAPAGITGLWQVKKYGHQNLSATERVNMDIDYARKSGLGMDCRILLATPVAIVKGFPEAEPAPVQMEMGLLTPLLAMQPEISGYKHQLPS